MCYLRNFTPIYTNLPSKHQNNHLIAQKQQKYFENIENSQNQKLYLSLSQKPKLKSNIKSNQNSLSLENLLFLAHKNSLLIQELQNKMNQNNNLMEQIQDIQECNEFIESNNDSNCQFQSLLSVSTEQTLNKNLFQSQQIITKKLFGQKKVYKYKLVLSSEFPSQLYKQRNFNFALKLVDSQNKALRNSNIIHLCLGVCDIKGEWIAQTKTGQPFMKGKTQSELYHGQAQYSKIYSRDVSRNYQEGKLNLIIYPKQSVIKYYERTNLFEQTINSDMIEPLIIKDLSIRAKKKD